MLRKGLLTTPVHRECLPTTPNHLGGPPDNSQRPKKVFQPPPAYREGLPSSPRTLGGPSGLSWPSRRAFRQLLTLRLDHPTMPSLLECLLTTFDHLERPLDNYRHPVRASRPLLDLREGLPTTLAFRESLSTLREGFPTTTGLQGGPFDHFRISGKVLPTNAGPPRSLYDYSWSTRRASRPLPAHLDDLLTTPGPTGGQPEHSRRSWRAS